MFSLPKRLLARLLICSFALLVSVHAVHAQACEDQNCDSDSVDEEISCIKQKKACIEKRLGEEQAKKSTFTNTINILNGKISIQQLQVRQTQAEVNLLEKQIGDLSNRIEGLNLSLDRLTTVMMERVRKQYKRTQMNPIAIIADSDSFNEFFTQYKYLSSASQQTVQAMERAETQRLAYDEQKSLKEEKQAEVEAKRAELQAEQTKLDQQKAEQQRFLAETQSNEARFQQLLAEANRQLAAFSRFVSVQGGASILTNQTKCTDWGCYYSQRDSQWGTMGIGRSSSSMAEYGCLVTSMAMIASYYDKSLTPGQIGGSSNPFSLNTAYMKQGSWTVNGVTMSRTRVGYNASALDTELERGKPVVIGIGSGPDHFLVIKEKRDGKYIMNDPFMPNGHDVVFTERYSLGSISAVDRVSAN